MIQRRQTESTEGIFDIDTEEYWNGVEAALIAIKTMLQFCAEKITGCFNEALNETVPEKITAERANRTTGMLSKFLSVVNKNLLSLLDGYAKNFLPLPISTTKDKIKEDSLKKGVDMTTKFAVQCFRNWIKVAPEVLKKRSKFFGSGIIPEYIEIIVSAIQNPDVTIAKLPVTGEGKTIVVVRELESGEEK